MIYANGACAWCMVSTGSETSPSYAPRNSRFGSEPPSVEDDVDVWRYAIVSCMPETTTHVPYVYCNEWSKEKKEHTSTVMITCCAGIVDKVH